MADCPTRTLESGVVVISPEGMLNTVSGPGLRAQLHALVRQGRKRLVVDMSGVGTIDSSGLGVLISGLKAARQSGGDLKITSPSDQATMVLELCNLNTVLTTCESAESAFTNEA